MKKIELKTFSNCGTLILLIFLLLFVSNCRKIEPERKPFSRVATLAGTSERFGEPFGVAVKGNEIFVSDGEKGAIWKIQRDGGATQILTDKLNTPSQIAFDKNGDLIVADSGSHTIKKIKSTGEIETLAGRENQSGFADGETANALFNAPVGIAASENKIYVADTYNDKIRVIENGKVSTLAGGGEQGFADAENGQAAKFDTPCGIALKNGKIIVADAGNRRIRVVEESGKTWTLAGNGQSDSVDGNLYESSFVQPLAVSVGNFGEIYIADGNSIRVAGRRFVSFVETISDKRRGFFDGDLKNARFNRPSGLATDEDGSLYVADSENQTLRVLTGENLGKETSEEEKKKLRFTAEEFRKSAEARWCYNPPQDKREIAGTLGEIRGEVREVSGGSGGSGEEQPVRFHNGLDIVGGYGETARFIRAEKALHPFAAQNFDTLRELVRMPTLGYIHIRLGRDKDNNLFNDKRFQFAFDEQRKLKGVRIPRGAKFGAGDAVGTLNAMNHVHLVAGRSGAEMNALDALDLPGISDKIAPVIENVSLYDENWQPLGETKTRGERIKLKGKTRIVARAYDRMDGNAERRRLGVYHLGYQILREDETPLTEEKITVSFALFPESADAARFVYAAGSKSGATGETVFNYIVSNDVSGEIARENFLDAASLEKGNYILRVFAADYFGNKDAQEISVEIVK